MATDIRVRLALHGAQQMMAGLKMVDATLKQTVGAWSRVMGQVSTVALAGGLAYVGKSAIQASTELDTFKRMLYSVSETVEEAEANLRTVAALARSPGLTFRQALEGLAVMRGLGMESARAARLIGELGNALALAGRSPEVMQRVLTQITQVIGKGTIQGEELRQMTEQLPHIRLALKTAFGATSAEELRALGISVDQFIDGLIHGAQVLPRAASGMENAFVNLKDTTWRALADIGLGFNRMLFPVMAQLDRTLTRLGESGALQRFGEALSGMVEPMMRRFHTWIKMFSDTKDIEAFFVYLVTWTGEATVAALKLVGAYKLLIALVAAASRQTVVAVAAALQAIGLFAIGIYAQEQTRAAIQRIRNLQWGGTDRETARTEWGPDGLPAMTPYGRPPGPLSSPSPSGQNPLESLSADMVQLLREIAMNTREQLTLERKLFGGAGLTRFGVTPVEITAFRAAEVSLVTGGG